MDNMKRDKKKNPRFVLGGIADGDDVEKLLAELDKMNLKLDNHIIAYIDFLGMKEKMNEKESAKSLYKLKYLLFNTESTAKSLSRINDISDFKIKLFSDNVVIALRVDEREIRNQMCSLLNLIISIQFYSFMQFGFWLRGGVTIGELSIDDSVVWGTGLIEAYNIENQIANYPRVIISDLLIEKYEKGNDSSAFPLNALIQKDDDGLWYLDFLLAAPNLKLIPMESEIIKERTKGLKDKDLRIKQKANWMISYFNRYCMKYSDRVETNNSLVKTI